MPDRLQVEQTLLAFLHNHHPECGPIEAETDMIESGQLDSIVLLDIVFALQTQFRLDVQPHEIAPKNFRSVRAIADWILSRPAVVSKAA